MQPKSIIYPWQLYKIQFYKIQCIVFLYSFRYEVLPTEPLHDVKEHIANVVSEITHQLTDDEKVAFRQTLELVSGTKDQLRGSDYREMAIVLAKQLRG